MKKARAAIVVVVLVALIVGCFYYVANRNPEKTADNVELTEVQKVITKDFEKNYPATPREVVKTYNRIITCFYNETYTEEELYALGDQARMLFDEELLESNPRDTYFKSLKMEIEEYKEFSRTIKSSAVCSSNEVETKTVDGVEYAYVQASYFIKDGNSYERTYQMYVLREDEEGRWKILMFYQIEGDTSDE